MPTSITLNERRVEKVAVLAAEAGQPVDAFFERVLQGLADADIENPRRHSRVPHAP
jgi:hypothetical protein